MSQYNDGFLTVTLTGTVAKHQRVTAAGAAATAVQPSIGYAQSSGVSGDTITVQAINKPGTAIAIVDAAVAIGDPVYSAADGEVSSALGAFKLGYALQAATADQDQIEILTVPAEVQPYLDAGQQALSGAGAITVDEYYTAWTTTSADAGTLADGSYVGQLKKIQLIVDGGDGTLTPTTLVGGTTIIFADAGDYALLIWTKAGWRALELGNDADGATAPVLA